MSDFSIPDSLEGYAPLPDPARFAIRAEALSTLRTALPCLDQCLTEAAGLALRAHQLWQRVTWAVDQLYSSDQTDPYRTGTKLVYVADTLVLDSLYVATQDVGEGFQGGGRLDPAVEDSLRARCN